MRPSIAPRRFLLFCANPTSGHKVIWEFVKTHRPLELKSFHRTISGACALGSVMSPVGTRKDPVFSWARLNSNDRTLSLDASRSFGSQSTTSSASSHSPRCIILRGGLPVPSRLGRSLLPARTSAEGALSCHLGVVKNRTPRSLESLRRSRSRGAQVQGGLYRRIGFWRREYHV